MRIAIVSDVHGNRTAFEAVLADLRRTTPDLVVHGGDLADGGASPLEIIDRIRDLGWPGVLGNTDEMLARPESLADYATRSPSLGSLFAAVADMAAATRDALGSERLAWLGRLPPTLKEGPMALVHGRPETPWQAPGPDASDAELESAFGVLGAAVVVYGHIHRPFVRRLARRTVANSGSVGLSHDGDPRAAYLLLDGAVATIRRVEYDVAREQAALSGSFLPHSDWVARMLGHAGPLLP